MGTDQSSPMLDQYRRIKKDHKGDILFFRLGDFYEMFAEDALEVSPLLNLTLTSRNGLPMCGVPYHAAHSYIARLLKLGKKIAVCEQVSEPVKGRQVIERQVVEVITPGTTVDADYLDKGSSNYLASLAFAAGGSRFLSFAYIELSTGEFRATSFPCEKNPERISGELERLQVREMVIQESLLEEEPGIARAIGERSGLVINRWPDWLFDPSRARKRLERQFGISSLKSLGITDESPELVSSGALLDYLDDTAKSVIPHVRTISLYQDSEFVGIDEATQRNLELVRNLRDGDMRFSLLEVLDETRTAMGRRLLKRRILHPLCRLVQIHARFEMTEALYRDQARLSALRDILGKMPDLERLNSRLAMDKAHGKDMLAIKNALVYCDAIRELRKALKISFESDTAACLNDEGFSRLAEIRSLLERGICDDPSVLIAEGNFIREGYSAELDALCGLRDNGRQLLEEYLEEEKHTTGIPSLKIRYNRLIGYFFEVTRAHLSKVPSRFIRRQGIVGGERFSTERLASLESDINGASDKIIELEKKLFFEIRDKAKECLSQIAAAAVRIAELDTAQSLAKAATIHGWVRPLVDDSLALEIYEARHPVVEAHLDRGEYIPNDIILNAASPPALEGRQGAEEGISFVLITGPNMAGKSTYLRSAALIVLMAQMGSFVPAREAHIGLCDRIYCRVGASDNLARGESTFLVEMNETAYILHTASEKSLVIMDEVGRGTGTQDGLSIAWAVSEELLNNIRCRTLFATHYHELSLISHPRMANRSMEVLDRDGEIVFLRRIKEGPSAESYGIHVARLAGLPKTVLERAKHIMDRLREQDYRLREILPADITLEAGPQKNPDEVAKTRDTSAENTIVNLISAQVNQSLLNIVNHNEIKVNEFCADPRFDRFLEEISVLDPDNISLLEALTLLYTLKTQAAAIREKKPGLGEDTPLRPSSKNRRPANSDRESPGLFD
ncbi:MAG: DNA mismatch repair protein MutS [Treponema sp.]|jgi:DNA mismatch repair protein MutS|nr:DNA mismatch repair protein MutS [Treponema sp.]